MPLKLDHITILVSSLATSMPYYAALLPLLGMRKQRDHVWTDGDGFTLQFMAARAGTRPYERYGAGVNHIGFAAPAADTVRAVREHMQQGGFPVPELQELDGVLALFMKDPDGFRVEVSYYPPGKSVVD